MNRAPLAAALALAAAIPLAAPAAADDIRTERVRFAPGATSAVIETSIKGRATVDYLLGARAGQYMNVSMATDNGANYFNILAPGETEVAIFNGSFHENQFEGVLTESGDYRVRVYLMRSAARRNEVGNYRLEMIITNATGDALVPGTEYHATGVVPCAMAEGAPAGDCPFGVVREGGGSGIVTVTKPDGRTRAIFFDKGTATGADVSEADPGDFSAARNGDRTTVRIGAERYEIPDAVIFGG